jgi:ribosomal 50S subunit-associated protein YjgA (DUF615 family)
MQSVRHYEAAVRAMSQAAAQVEASQAPIRRAYSEMAALDTLLARLEELRLIGERSLPEDLRELAVGYAERHDAELLSQIGQARPDDLNAVHDAVFEAQGRVMLHLAGLRRVPNWRELEAVLEPGGEEAA